MKRSHGAKVVNLMVPAPLYNIRAVPVDVVEIETFPNGSG
jgi:hypothetical protein